MLHPKFILPDFESKPQLRCTHRLYRQQFILPDFESKPQLIDSNIHFDIKFILPDFESKPQPIHVFIIVHENLFYLTLKANHNIQPRWRIRHIKFILPDFESKPQLGGHQRLKIAKIYSTWLWKQTTTCLADLYFLLKNLFYLTLKANHNSFEVHTITLSNLFYLTLKAKAQNCSKKPPAI